MPEMLKEIETLKTKLIHLGYHPDELEYILLENVPLAKSPESFEYLNDQIEFLQSFLNFANKSVGVR